MDQSITLSELAKILKDFMIAIPIDKINQILIYLEINPFNFTLNDFHLSLQKCKILSYEINTDETINIYLKLRDIIYNLGGEIYFFGNNPHVSDSLSKKKFVSLLKSKFLNVNYTEDILEVVFNYLTKTDRNMTLEEFRKYFVESKLNELNDDFVYKAIALINSKIKKLYMKDNEYYDHLLLKKPNRSDNTLTKPDLQKFFNSEFNFNSEEIDFLFRRMDFKKDGVIDREEFLKFANLVNDALFKIKDVIKKEKLDIEELMYKMNIDRKNKKESKRFDLITFKMSNST